MSMYAPSRGGVLACLDAFQTNSSMGTFRSPRFLIHIGGSEEKVPHGYRKPKDREDPDKNTQVHVWRLNPLDGIILFTAVKALLP